MIRLVITCFFLSLLARGWSQEEIKIRIYSNVEATKAIVTPDSVPYYLLAYDEELNKIDTVLDVFPEQASRTLYFTVDKGYTYASLAGEKLGKFDALRLQSKKPGREFRIAVKGRERAYQGELQIRSYRGAIQIINKVDLDKYVAGVVESESGHIDEPEFYKAQAILARTYALRNMDKHIEHGYNLKDDVTSQVYFSKCHYVNKDLIEKAVAATEDTVLVTDECVPVLGAFHANSGGETVNAEDAWLKPVNYLKSKSDSFSIGTGSYRWEKKIPKRQLFGYFARMLGVENSAELQQALLNFKQKHRKNYFTYQGKRLKLARIRSDLHLKSTFFSVYEDGNYALLKGYGYGHGVGLSQDGAIKMAKEGYHYRDILYFYYEKIELDSINHLKTDT